MMSVMREIEEYVLNSPIKITSAYDKLVENFRSALPARQRSHPQSTLNRAGGRRREPSVSFRLLRGVDQWANATPEHIHSNVAYYPTESVDGHWLPRFHRESDSQEFR